MGFDEERIMLQREILVEKSIPKRIALFKTFAEEVIHQDDSGTISNFPWGENDKDGFPHQGAAYILLDNIVRWDETIFDEHPDDPKLETIIKIDDIVNYLELPPQTDQEERQENDPQLPEREKDWQQVAQLVQSL